MSLLWNFPGRNVSLGIAAVVTLLGAAGYLASGLAYGAKLGGSVGLGLVVAGWVWATLENYNPTSR